jgi:hypothetical protein
VDPRRSARCAFGHLLAAIAVAAAFARPTSAADDPLARARQLYNQRQFEAAVSAAEEARLIPARADEADLVAARAYLERFRDSAAPDDLTKARDRLRRLDPQRLSPLQRTEYIVGLGETLYFDGEFGAAADVFESVLHGSDLISGEARERVVDWWASAIDHDAKPRPDMDRRAIYQQARSRLAQELASHPGSSAAAYWLAAAARAQGDLQSAWETVESGWVRATLLSDHGVGLRADLDRLMTRIIIPERAKVSAVPPDVLQQQWEQFKMRWTR